MQMTNQEYEAASITAAGYADKFEGEHKLKQMDEIIKNLETSLANLHEQRREIVNQYNLNRGGFLANTQSYVVGEQ